MRWLKAGFLVSGLVFGAGAALAQTSWEMPTEYPETAIPGEGVANFARLVNERAGGRLTVKPSFDAKRGIKSAQMIAAVQKGEVAAGDAFAGALGAVDPLFGLSSLPFLATSIDDARRLTDLARPAYEKKLAGFGQKLLYTTPWPASGIWSKTPLDSAAALTGLSIRTYDATSTAVMNAAGAKAANLSFADAMPKVKDGSVVAVLSSGDGGAGRNLWDYLPNFTEVNYAMPISIASVNLAAYEALPADLRQVVDAAAQETEQRQWAAIRTRLGENYARMRANKVAIRTEVPPDLALALAKAGRMAVEEWQRKAGPEGREMLKQYDGK
ncbi:MAG: TRAP transporter substrate-binding protein [Bosea sp.]|uniref:TRAP transporter substrate-binding protein n=1 Tax=unclassified Bosea (in: a-proteobacteria) TaxID=2653178 RepID=UPI0009596506|nr:MULTISPECIES: TRAP transporter substrate-binding protein [unclassified Bosea (in: a-proteobacteria)]MBN9455606.1 TRAP transporter substrate-binding protein [Bosea sp. (in: a-proteobacteria)]OJV05187.1 MAG: signal peptidase [Bosea sp. 67-29]